jgi:hypothetical protein
MEAPSDAFELKAEARDRGVETPATDEDEHWRAKTPTLLHCVA